jgi:hypothetical protein
MAMVTVGTDGVVDYVQVPDGQKYMLGPVSVLRLITGVAKSHRSARVALEEFLANGKTMLSVDLDEMWDLLPFRRARYSSTNPFMLEWDHSDLEPEMKTASYDTLIAHVEMAEDIVTKVAETDLNIDRLVADGKRFDSIRAKADLLKIASRVAEIAEHVDLAQGWVGADLADLSARASEIHGLFSLKQASELDAAEVGDSIVLSKDLRGHAHEGFKATERVRVTGRRTQHGDTMLELRSGKGVVLTVSADEIKGELKE